MLIRIILTRGFSICLWKTPLLIGLNLLVLVCILVFFFIKFISSWVSLIFFVTYISGIIVIFSYFCATTGSVFLERKIRVLVILLIASYTRNFYSGGLSNTNNTMISLFPILSNIVLFFFLVLVLLLALLLIGICILRTLHSSLRLFQL